MPLIFILEKQLVLKLLKDLYGIPVVVKQERLESYADINYLVTAKHHASSCTQFVVKVFCNSGCHQSIGDALQHLHGKGLSVSKAIPALNGEIVSKYEFNEKTYSVLLLEYMKGKTLCDLVLPQHEYNNIAYQSGIGFALIDKALSDLTFPCEFLEQTSQWNLLNLNFAKSCLAQIPSIKTKARCVRVMELFEHNVVTNLDKLQAGVIHGDPNDANIILKQQLNGTKGQWFISGIIDFGDMGKSFYLFEVAILIAYFMMKAFKDGLDCDKPAELVLAGYQTVLQLTPLEQKLLYTVVAETAVHSLCCSAVDAVLSPQNHDYIMQDYESFEKLLFHLCEAKALQ